METNRHLLFLAGTARFDWLVAVATALANREVRPAAFSGARGTCAPKRGL